MCGSCSYKIRQKDVVGGEKRKEGDQAEAARTRDACINASRFSAHASRMVNNIKN